MTSEPLDVLVVAAHPDDAEIAVGGLLAMWSRAGKRCGVIDLTAGERGTRGDGPTRARESQAAAAVLGLAMRETLGLPDARLRADVAAREQLAARLRLWRPALLIGHGPGDPHPDHNAAAQLVDEAWFLAGVGGLELGGALPAQRPRQRLHFCNQRGGTAHLVIPIDAHWETKLAALRCHASQMAGGADHRLGGRDPLASLEARARSLAALANCEFAEGLDLVGPTICRDPFTL